MPPTPLIAVVDDDASAREAMVALVKAMGFAAAGYPSAAEFLGSRSATPCDCLITDIRMAGMSGIELFLHLAAAGTPIPTILMTAYPDEPTRCHARDIGIRFYLPKPCNPEELLQCLRQLHRP